MLQNLAMKRPITHFSLLTLFLRKIRMHTLLITMSLVVVNSHVNAQEISTPERLAAYEGNPEAQFKLALFYSQETSNKAPNFKRAAYCYMQAARQGMANAQYNLGHFYLQGIGVEQNTSKTIQWWEQAAHQNYSPAQHNIGTAYFEGVGVEANAEFAKLWFQRCADLGSEACTQSLTVVKKNTTDSTSIEHSHTPEPQPKHANTSRIISAHIQARPSSTIIAKLSSQQAYEVIETRGNWQKVKLKQAVEAWCYKSYVRINKQNATLTGDKVRARTTPSTQTGKIITELTKGTQFTVLEEKDKWVKLALPDHIAWIKTPEKKPHTRIAKTATQGPSSDIKSANRTIKISAPAKLQQGYAFLDRRSDDEWLFQSNPEQFTLLLSSFDNNSGLKQFANQVNLANNTDMHLLLAKRENIEWKYAVFGNFDSPEAAKQAIKQYSFQSVYIERIGNIQEQRCSAWKTTIPAPKKLPNFCLKKTAVNS